jgi:hypothetical protein
MEKGKWFVRVACITIVVGFFIPTMAVSCSGGLIDTKQAFSLSDLAGRFNQTGLYLLPVAAIAALVFSFLIAASLAQQKTYLWGQAGSMVVGLVSVIGSLLSLSNQIQQGTYGLFQTSLEFGAYVLIAGLIAFGVGWVMQWQSLGSPGVDLPETTGRLLPHVSPVDPGPPVSDRAPNGPYLEVIQGQLPERVIPILSDSFSMGRSSENQLILPDRTVSKLHVRLRYAQGAWYLQDQDSGNGTFVNGDNVQALRLNSGDEIAIGPFRFIIHL